MANRSTSTRSRYRAALERLRAELANNLGNCLNGDGPGEPQEAFHGHQDALAPSMTELEQIIQHLLHSVYKTSDEAVVTALDDLIVTTRWYFFDAGFTTGVLMGSLLGAGGMTLLQESDPPDRLDLERYRSSQTATKAEGGTR